MAPAARNDPQHVYHAHLNPIVMHSALLVSEIFAQILLELSNRDLFSLSTTCHDLSEPALDQLWSTQSSLVPLVKCLPKELVCDNGVGELSFSRALTCADWDVLVKYTHRIRHLKEVTYDNSKCDHGWVPGVERLSQDILQALSHPPPPASKSPFPRLESLTWLGFDVDAEATSFLRTLSGPRVTSLDLGGFTLRRASTESADLFQLIADLSVLFPALKSFAFSLPSMHTPNRPDLVAAFSRAVSGWKHLRVLSCGPLDVPTLLHLAHLPALENLDTSLPIYGLDSSNTLQLAKGAFSRLRDLAMWHGHGFKQVIDIFDAIPRRLPELSKLYLNAEDRDGPDDIQRLNDIISRRVQVKALKELAIKEESTVMHSEDNWRVTLLTLQPALVFTQLESVILSTSRPISLTDSELVTLADAWPKLRSLAINPNYGWMSPSGLTISGLAAALDRWPELQYLALAINARETSTSTSCADVSLCQRGAPASLKDLDLLDSRIGDNHEAVGTCLANILANARYCQVSAWNGVHPDYALYEESWPKWRLAVDFMRNRLTAENHGASIRQYRPSDSRLPEHVYSAHLNTTVMHPALLVSEILCQILSALSDNKDLFAVSVTCHDLSEPSLDQLWSTQLSLVPLVKCLPRDLIRCETERNAGGVAKLSFTRGLTSADWDVLLKYAHRIRVLRGVTRDSHHKTVEGWELGRERLSPEILETLSNPPKEIIFNAFKNALFPHLESITWQDFDADSAEAMSFLRSFAGPKLKTLSMNGFLVQRQYSSEFLSKLVSEFSVLYPELRTFTIPLMRMHVPNRPDIVSVLSRAVRGWKDMRVLKCGPLDVPAIRHLAHLRALERFETDLPIYGFRYSKTLQFPDQAFSCLRTLGLNHGRGFKQIIEFFQAIPGHLPQLSKLTLLSDRQDNPDDIQRLNDIIARRVRTETLRELIIVERNILDPHVADTRVTFSTLQPLLDFARLEFVCLTTDRTIVLTDKEFVMLANAWPKLTALLINETHGWQSPSGVTIAGLTAALERWTMLYYLALAIDARKVSTDAYFADVSSHQRRAPASLRDLNLLDSRIEDNHEAVGTCLSKILTNTRSCHVSAWNNAGASYELYQENKPRWSLAIDFMKDRLSADS
ncbi:hypothetical protein CONPUDRAFT_142143 [Coniophora puteana RWD-64-598 SS2]|uniref:F-box domain-containing protein n=1 Tax=Coniophora puteana (strain RWD-64-598) TaxID=741705 RepID=A0A5M3N2Q7_CONPW|nr:uncharacterized protein CONPUDRAFT_142143 [Coniophora puteana RWD-64-598 SS2]EIW85670.1 hypothetical protein CONPUDRAFT_142143 [Coniophora puteana RWD-64-598 SS2]